MGEGSRSGRTEWQGYIDKGQQSPAESVRETKLDRETDISQINEIPSIYRASATEPTTQRITQMAMGDTKDLGSISQSSYKPGGREMCDRVLWRVRAGVSCGSSDFWNEGDMVSQGRLTSEGRGAAIRFRVSELEQAAEPGRKHKEMLSGCARPRLGTEHKSCDGCPHGLLPKFWIGYSHGGTTSEERTLSRYPIISTYAYTPCPYTWRKAPVT